MRDEFPLSSTFLQRELLTRGQRDAADPLRLAELVGRNRESASMTDAGLQMIRESLRALGSRNPRIIEELLLRHPSRIETQVAPSWKDTGFYFSGSKGKPGKVLASPEVKAFAHELTHGALDLVGRRDEQFPGLIPSLAGRKRHNPEFEYGKTPSAISAYKTRNVTPSELLPMYLENPQLAPIFNRGEFLRAIEDWFGTESWSGTRY